MVDIRKQGVSDNAYQTLQEADTNGDGYVSSEELAMYLEFKRKELEDQDAQRDAMRKMTWFALFGMLLYPIVIVFTSWIDVDDAAQIIGNIAPTYFVAISALVAAFFGANAYSTSKKTDMQQQMPMHMPSRPTPSAPMPPSAEDYSEPEPDQISVTVARATPRRKIM